MFDTGLYYLQSRYYDPEIGRFINADVFISTDITGPLSANMYAYCENNPVNASDPNGELTLGLAAAGALIGGITNAAMTYMMSGGTADFGTLVGAFVGGAVGGILTFSAAGKLKVAALNAVAGVVGYAVETLIHGDEFSGKEILFAAASGFASGLIAGDGIMKDGEVAKHAKVYDQLKYNISSKSEADMFFNAAAGFQTAAREATGNSVIRGIIGSTVGNSINKLLNRFFAG